MNWFKNYIQNYLKGPGAIVPGANYIGESFPTQPAHMDTTRLMRESFDQHSSKVAQAKLENADNTSMQTLNFTANAHTWFALSSPFSAINSISLSHLVQTSALSLEAAAIIKDSQDAGNHLVAIYAAEDGTVSAVFNEQVLSLENPKGSSFTVNIGADGKVRDWKAYDEPVSGFEAIN